MVITIIATGSWGDVQAYIALKLGFKLPEEGAIQRVEAGFAA